RLAALELAGASQRELVQRFRRATGKNSDDKDAAKAERQALHHQLNEEAATARLLPALQSPRQLQEVMVDFWYNHFNVFQGKGLDHALVANYEREAIRPFVLGRFRDLLGATAHHPAMLFYLDNWLSTAPGFQPLRARGTESKGSGLNENYARELMELHTLGVDGGYSQQDVTELARMLTGWTFDPRAGNGRSLFVFAVRRHDDGNKQWLGHNVLPRGQNEGEWALDVLAEHPATANHIAFALAQYFVSDAPPPALVDRLAKRFRDSGGDIRSVLSSLFASPEFRNPAVYGAKFKNPYRYLLSALRAAEQPVDDVRPLLGALRQQGMPLYGCQTPDGYKNTETAWLNPDAMTRRVAFATALGGGRLPFQQSTAVDAVRLQTTLGMALSDKTLATVERSDPRLRSALILGSPDFMRY
ncbi:MAG: DUF1800 domain-containing protein, partial [Betaproteobacteria bacterium]|nr:DUF1800 domain-containing protein [Betaproteobacteria bacterium]